MPRVLIAFAAIAALAAPLVACSRTPPAEVAPPPAPTHLAAAPALAAAIGQWKAGTNYVQLRTPQPTNVAAGKIEVNEIFWYGCAHCYALDPTLESWKANKPAYVEFVRIPVMWGPVHKQHAKLFYVLKALGRDDLHAIVFDAIHQKGTPLSAQSDEQARAAQLAFARANGISAKDFNNAYDSMSVALNLQRAQDATQRFHVEGVPLMIVNGKYTTDIGQAGNPSQLVRLINDLAASEKGR